ALGWFSVGLGLSQLLAPRTVARLIGMKDGGGAGMRLLGARELASGIALLTNRRAAWWTGARTAGDLLDLALLRVQLARPGNDRGRLAMAAAAVIGAGAADAYATAKLGEDPARPEQVARVTHVGKAITVEASARELYAFWRDLSNLPRIFEHLELVEAV